MKAPLPAAGVDLTAAFHEHDRYLFGLCYRMTGSAAEAQDLVQDTYVRALQSPPARADEPLRPWLVKVAVNLGRDALRARRRRGYVGPWLPDPIETEEAVPSVEVSGAGGGGTETRYDLLESVSFAFLLALEALTPQQRAVLVLRDVFDYSVKETADALGLTEANVKTTHHRARRALEPYDEARCRPTPRLAAEARATLQRFLQALTTNDAGAVEALLAEDARALSDGGGEQRAARKTVVGRDRVARMYLGLTRTAPPPIHAEIRVLNGLPAFVAELPDRGPSIPRRLTIQIALDGDGRIAAVYSVVAVRKLGALRPFA